MFRRILVAWDSSDEATHAFAVAADVASKYGADLVVLAVLPRFDDAETSGKRRESTEYAREHFERGRAKLEEIASHHGVDFHLADIEAQHAADAIVEYANAHGFDLVVMGRRGAALAGVERFLLGSTSDGVIRYAHCPVLVVSNSGTPATRR